jgi:signal transduction histidine kinase
MRFRPLYLIPVFLMVTLLTGVYIGTEQSEMQNKHRENLISNLQIAFDEIINGYERSANIIYSEVINQPEVLSFFAGAYPADEAERTEIRDELYSLLADDYERLGAVQLRQLHFHLPDDVSFLRFHRPERYGDDLTGIRYTVTLANTERIPVAGFEEGRIYNGFRYVFPLSWEGQHIGTVETSVSFSAIESDMNELLPGGVSFMLDADVVDAKVFEDEQANYVLTDLSDQYAYDRAVIENFTSPNITWDTIERINASLSPDVVDDHLALGEAFALDTVVDDTAYTVTFIPVVNVQGDHVGYIMNHRADDFIITNHANYAVIQAIIGIVAVMTVFFLWRLDHSTQLINCQHNALAKQNTMLEHTNEQLTIAKQQADAANELKSQFLANMSHELRTPLNAILNFTRFVSSGMMGSVNEKQIEALETVTDNSKHLLALINDILDISKIEVGLLQLFIEDDIDLDKEYNAVVDVARSSLADKPIALRLQKEVDLPRITADRRRVRQIMLNLVSNACKFTNEGMVAIRLNREGNDVVFSVTDTGMGIAKEDRERIFKTFHQTNSAIKKGGGTGLGLPISRRLAEIHGGSLTFASQEGVGSIFTLRLPIHAQETDQLKEAQEVALVMG